MSTSTVYRMSSSRFQGWLYEEVIPSIRKTGVYILQSKYKSELKKIQEELLKYKRGMQVLINNQRKERYPQGSIVYVLQPVGVE
jgi:prophage antirepressor-like protein